MLPTGEREFSARNAGLSSIIVFSTIIPLLLIILVVSYRHIKMKNLEAEAQLKKRRRTFEKFFSNEEKEIEIREYFEAYEVDQTGLHKMDKESLPSSTNKRNSIDENDALEETSRLRPEQMSISAKIEVLPFTTKNVYHQSHL